MSNTTVSAGEIIYSSESVESQVRFDAAQVDFAERIADRDSGRRNRPRLLRIRTELVRATEKLLEDSVYVEVTGDFHLQLPQATGRPSESGFHAEGLQLPSDKLWVGPYNHQTEGYAELDGSIMTHKAHGDVPVLAWRGEPILGPGYPLIASMAKVALRGIDDRADNYPVTRRYGLTRNKPSDQSWKRIFTSSPEEVRDVISETIPLLVEEGKALEIESKSKLQDIFTHSIPDSRCWLAVGKNGLVQKIEFGWSPNSLVSEKYLFEGSNKVVLSYTPHTSHLNRPGIYSSTYRRAHFLNESNEASSVSYAASALIKVFEVATMTTGNHRNHTTGFGMYAK